MSLDTNLEYNQFFRKWTSKVRRKIKSSAKWFVDGKQVPFVQRGAKSGHRRTEGKLAASIKTKMKQDFGRYESVSFNFERHGIFIQKGVGRGYKMAGSFVTRTAKSAQQGERYAVDWINPVLNENIPELADKLAALDANAVLKSMTV